MTIVAVDIEVNCKRMLLTGKYQTDNLHADECLWLIKYMRKNGYSEEDIYQRWKMFWSKDKPTYDDSDFRKNFKSFSKNANSVLFKKRNKIIIYKDEIDYINDLPMPLWMRQYVYILMVHSKATGCYEYDSIPYGDYAYWLSLKNKRKHENMAHLSQALKNAGILKDIVTKVHHDMYQQLDEYGNVIGFENDVYVEDYKILFQMNADVKKSNVFGQYETIIDALGNIGVVNDIYKCQNCGATFIIGNYTQRVLCEKCYKESRKEQKRDWARKRSLYIDSTVKDILK